jgi:hypothetical protein
MVFADAFYLCVLTMLLSYCADRELNDTTGLYCMTDKMRIVQSINSPLSAGLYCMTDKMREAVIVAKTALTLDLDRATEARNESGLGDEDETRGDKFYSGNADAAAAAAADPVGAELPFANEQGAESSEHMGGAESSDGSDGGCAEGGAKGGGGDGEDGEDGEPMQARPETTVQTRGAHKTLRAKCLV